MEKNIEVSFLLDFYGQLLKPSARETIELYYNEDLSLSEIASQLGITRQGVRDNIKRSEQQLFEYEKKLGLYKNFTESTERAEEILRLAAVICETAESDDIKKLANDIIAAVGSIGE